METECSQILGRNNDPEQLEKTTLASSIYLSSTHQNEIENLINWVIIAPGLDKLEATTLK